MGDAGRLAGAALVLAAAALGGCASDEGRRIQYDRPAPSPPVPTLDGRVFLVELPMEGGPPLSDRLAFRDGAFESSMCSAAGFQAVPYRIPYSRAESSGEVAVFAVDCESPDNGLASWRGTVRGDAIEGTLLRTPADGTAPFTVTFKGRAAR